MCHSYLLLRLGGHIHACIRTATYACSRVHLSNCMRGNATHFDLGNISPHCRAKFWSRSCLETSSRWIIQTLLWTAPSSVWWNLKTARGQNKLVVGPKQSFTARRVGVHFCPVMSDQRFIGSRRSQFLSQHLSTGKVAAETELYSVHTVFFLTQIEKRKKVYYLTWSRQHSNRIRASHVSKRRHFWVSKICTGARIEISEAFSQGSDVIKLHSFS